METPLPPPHLVRRQNGPSEPSAPSRNQENEVHKLGDFSKLHSSVIASSPIATPPPFGTPRSDSRILPPSPPGNRLGDFSKIFDSFFGDLKHAAASSRQKLGTNNVGAGSTAKDDGAEAQPRPNIASLLSEYLALDVHRATDTEPEPESEVDGYERTFTPATTAGTISDTDLSSFPLKEIIQNSAPYHQNFQTQYIYVPPIVTIDPPVLRKILSYQLDRSQPPIPIYAPRVSKKTKRKTLATHADPLRALDAELAKQFPFLATNGVYVFLDMSNIHISFHKLLRMRHNIAEHARLVPLPGLDLDLLTKLLVRGREARVMHVGCSKRPDKPNPAYVEDLQHLGWRVDLRSRRRAEEAGEGTIDYMSSSDEARAGLYTTPLKQKSNIFKNYANLYTPSSVPQSAPIPSTKPRPPQKQQQQQHNQPVRYVEDLVDETLQTRIGESVMEHFQQPGTLVFATGDARPAKYSAGFQKYALLALRMGWAVEVVSWRSSLSTAWRKNTWAKEFGERFRVIELDGFVDELLL